MHAPDVRKKLLQLSCLVIHTSPSDQTLSRIDQQKIFAAQLVSHSPIIPRSQTDPRPKNYFYRLQDSSFSHSLPWWRFRATMPLIPQPWRSPVEGNRSGGDPLCHKIVISNGRFDGAMRNVSKLILVLGQPCC